MNIFFFNCIFFLKIIFDLHFPWYPVDLGQGGGSFWGRFTQKYIILKWYLLRLQRSEYDSLSEHGGLLTGSQTQFYATIILYKKVVTGHN